MKAFPDVGGGRIGDILNPTNNASLANISLGWMVREAIEADVELLFRPEAFDSYLGVLATIGPRNCYRAGLNLPPARVGAPPTKLNVVNRYVYNDWNDWKPNEDEEVDEEEASARSTRAAEMERAFANDACAGMGDQLGAWWSGWWILEWLPNFDIRVHPNGKVSRRPWYVFSPFHLRRRLLIEVHFSWNRGKGRAIPTRPVLFHHSVALRESRENYRPLATWWCGEYKYVES